MRAVIMQPGYLPWMGYFDLLKAADLFLVYDHCQFDKDSWRNRNRVKTSQGIQWLTVPVLTKGQEKPTNREIKINNKINWNRKHLKSLEMNYRKARHFQTVYPMMEQILSRQWDYLIDLNMAFVLKISEFLQIDSRIEFTSQLKLDLPPDRNDKLVAMCKSVQADEFYEPSGGKGYINPESFAANQIKLVFQEYEHPVYPQLFGDFVSHLSVVDLLMNCGPESAEFFRKEVRQK